MEIITDLSGTVTLRVPRDFKIEDRNMLQIHQPAASDPVIHSMTRDIRELPSGQWEWASDWYRI